MSGATPVPGPINVVDTEAYLPRANDQQHRETIKAVHAINASGAESLFGENCRLKFRLDSGSRRPIIEVVDRTSERVIFQIPPENVVRLANGSRTSGVEAAAYYEPSVPPEPDQVGTS